MRKAGSDRKSPVPNTVVLLPLGSLSLSLITCPNIFCFLDRAKTGGKLTLLLLKGMEWNAGLIPLPAVFQPHQGQNCDSPAHPLGRSTTIIPQLTKPATPRGWFCRLWWLLGGEGEGINTWREEMLCYEMSEDALSQCRVSAAPSSAWGKRSRAVTGAPAAPTPIELDRAV